MVLSQSRCWITYKSTLPLPPASLNPLNYFQSPLDKSLVCRNSIGPVSKIISCPYSHSFLAVGADKMTEINFLGWCLQRYTCFYWQEWLSTLWFIFLNNVRFFDWKNRGNTGVVWHFPKKPKRSIPTVLYILKPMLFASTYLLISHPL